MDAHVGLYYVPVTTRDHTICLTALCISYAQCPSPYPSKRLSVVPLPSTPGLAGIGMSGLISSTGYLGWIISILVASAVGPTTTWVGRAIILRYRRGQEAAAEGGGGEGERGGDHTGVDGTEGALGWRIDSAGSDGLSGLSNIDESTLDMLPAHHRGLNTVARV